MSLSQGRQYLAIPGPSVIPDRVLQAMNQPCPNIYEGDLIELTHSLIPDLKHVAQTKCNVAIYVANGHGAWEAAISNVLAPDDTVLVLATGRFCIGWGGMAENLSISRQFDVHPFNSISLEISFKFFDLLEANVMDAPSEAKAQALAKPIPDEAPTTNAFFPVSLKEGITGRPVTS